MRQKLFIAIIAILWVPMGLMGQTYSELWKQVRDAQEIDLTDEFMLPTPFVLEDEEEER